jgi:DtxR family transcriptional regulator, Mn-dependent transcriptional regulator
MVNSERSRYLSKATGDVLKAIHALQLSEDNLTSVAPSLIATRTKTSRPFVTKMLQSMYRDGLVRYTPYRGVLLTDSGERFARELSRHHRLLERFLTDTLGFGLEAAHAEAERLEHVISEEFEARLAAFLNHPTTCPHGSPIPEPENED